jgi:hypothetical protein
LGLGCGDMGRSRHEQAVVTRRVCGASMMTLPLPNVLNLWDGLNRAPPLIQCETSCGLVARWRLGAGQHIPIAPANQQCHLGKRMCLPNVVAVITDADKLP